MPLFSQTTCINMLMTLSILTSVNLIDSFVNSVVVDLFHTGMCPRIDEKILCVCILLMHVYEVIDGKYSVLFVAELVMLTAETVNPIPDVDDVSGRKGIELSKTPIELENGDWCLKAVPWIGGRIISMTHIPSGNACVGEQVPESN